MTEQRGKGDRSTLLDRFYTVGVIVKGIDGAVEFLIGMILLFTPALAHDALAAISSEAAENQNVVRQFIAAYVDNLDDQLARSGTTFLVVFLILHGVVKLVLVYCLLRKLHRVYPIALAVLLAFLGYQVYAIVMRPTVGAVILAVLDAVAAAVGNHRAQRLGAVLVGLRHRTAVGGLTNQNIMVVRD